MALIKCPDCGKMFSEFAKCCPVCGCPTEDAKAESIYNVPKKEANNEDGSHTSAVRSVSVPKPEHKSEDVSRISESDNIKESKPTHDSVQETSNVVNDDKEAEKTEGVPISTEKETEIEGKNKADKRDRRTNGFAKYIAFGLIAAVAVVLLVIRLVNSKAPTPLSEKDDSSALVIDSANNETEKRDEKILERAEYIFKNIPDHEDFDSVDKSVFSASFIEVLEKVNTLFKENIEQGDLSGDGIVYWYSGQDGDSNDGLVGMSVSSSNDRLAYVTVKYRNFEVAEHRMKLIFQDGLWVCDNWDEKKEELLEEIDAIETYRKSVEGVNVSYGDVRTEGHTWIDGGLTHHHLVGTMSDNTGDYPIELDFDCSGNADDIGTWSITNAVYKNVQYGGKIRMSGEVNRYDDRYINDYIFDFKGKDGNKVFSISLNPVSWVGDCYVGDKHLTLSVSPQCSHN